MTNLASQIESILFVASKPLHTKQLAKFLQIPDEEVQSALLELQLNHKELGIVVLEANGYWQMATKAENVETVKNFLNSDLREKLTDATVEVLAIIAYRQPLSKAEIEAIRGVNSQYSIRHLLMRGLIEKVPNPNDARGGLYQVTTEFMQHLGIQSINDLPEFEKLVAHIKLPETPQAANPNVNPEDPVEEVIVEEIGEISPSAEAPPFAKASEDRSEDLRQEVISTTEIIVETQGNEDTRTTVSGDEEEEFEDDDDDEDEEGEKV